MTNGLHNGHRERVRKAFLEHGFPQGTPPHKVLEMLLFYSIPRQDTNELAHRLINHFGSVSAVFDASAAELMQVKGVSENTAALIKLILPVARLYSDSKKSDSVRFGNINEVYKFLADKYMGCNNEKFAVTSVSHKGAILGFDVLAEGCNSEVTVSTRKLMETVLMRKAAYILISHNHPDGLALPSAADIETTERIINTMRSVGVGVLDHIILVEDDYVSLRQSEKFKHLFE